jgi:hypothetical protein
MTIVSMSTAGALWRGLARALLELSCRGARRAGKPLMKEPFSCRPLSFTLEFSFISRAARTKMIHS